MSLAALLRRTYHLQDVAPEHPIRRAAEELERLYPIERELAEVSRALGGDAYWMDPPDGGSVTIAEQVARANAAGRAAHGAARIAELERTIETLERIREQRVDILARGAVGLCLDALRERVAEIRPAKVVASFEFDAPGVSVSSGQTMRVELPIVKGAA